MCPALATNVGVWIYLLIQTPAWPTGTHLAIIPSIQILTEGRKEAKNFELRAQPVVNAV